MTYIPRPEHPRPDLRRADDWWLNLNGTWQFEIDRSVSGQARGLASGRDLAAEISVPFCPESRLSGIGDTDFLNSVWYRRTLTLPERWKGRRVLLHVGACDYATTVWLNGRRMGDHAGGYVPITVELTDALKGDGADELVIRAIDENRHEGMPRGKQSERYESVRLPLHPHDRHLADGLAGGRAAHLRGERARLAEPGGGHAGAGHLRAGGGPLRRAREHGRRAGGVRRRGHGARAGGAEAGRAACLVAGGPAPLRDHGRAGRAGRPGPADHLRRPAQFPLRGKAPAAEQRAHLPAHRARPGLLPGRHLHRTERHRAGGRHRRLDGLRLQRRAPAREGLRAAVPAHVRPQGLPRLRRVPGLGARARPGGIRPRHPGRVDGDPHARPEPSGHHRLVSAQ